MLPTAPFSSKHHVMRSRLNEGSVPRRNGKVSVQERSFQMVLTDDCRRW